MNRGERMKGESERGILDAWRTISESELENSEGMGR
jgi:hypothetical protein